jgi:hypothetical protein
MRLFALTLAACIALGFAAPKPAEAGKYSIIGCWGDVAAGLIESGLDSQTAAGMAMDVCLYNWKRSRMPY